MGSRRPEAAAVVTPLSRWIWFGVVEAVNQQSVFFVIGCVDVSAGHSGVSKNSLGKCRW